MVIDIAPCSGCERDASFDCLEDEWTADEDALLEDEEAAVEDRDVAEEDAYVGDAPGVLLGEEYDLGDVVEYFGDVVGVFEDGEEPLEPDEEDNLGI